MAISRSYREVLCRQPRSLLWMTFAVSPFLLVAFAPADEPPLLVQDAPLVKAEAKEAAAGRKKDDPQKAQKEDAPNKEDQKPDVPSGYEDAAEAGDRPPPLAAAVEVVEAIDVEDGDVLVELGLANVDANIANIEKQFLPQFKPLLTAELSFINRVCDLSLEQRKEIKAASDKCLRAAVRAYATTQNGRMRGGLGRRQMTMHDPTELLHRTLAKTLKETLRSEQLTAYQEEMASRRADRKRAAVTNVVAIIDERLVLTVEQRKQLTVSLDANWQPTWVQSLEMLINNTQYLPSIPDRFVVSALNETQKEVWRTAQKQNYIVWGAFGWGQLVEAVDDFPLVELEGDIEQPAVN